MQSTVDRTGSPTGGMHARNAFPAGDQGHTVVRVRNQGEWPAAEFRVYVEQLMLNAGIPSVSKLARLADVDQGLISKWLNGHHQPSRANLKKLAVPLRVPPANLYFQAGLEDEGDLNITGQYDLSKIAPEYRALLDLDDDPVTDPDERAFLRQSVATLIAGVLGRRGERGRQGRHRPKGGRASA